MRTATAIPVFLLLVSTFTPQALAQPDEDTFERLTTRDGLARNFITGIVQDKQGFMWFATYGGSGLSKFDGYEFTTYRHDPRDSTSLADDRLDNLYVDSRGTLWVGTYAGLDRFDPITETFTHYRHDPEDSTSLSDDRAFVMLEDHEGVLWVGTNFGGLNRFNRETETFTHFRHDPDDPTSLSDDNVRILYEDRQGTLWVGTGSPYPQDEAPGNEGLNRFDRATGAFTRYHHDPDDEHSLIDDRIGAIYEDSQGTFWVGTWGDGLHTMDRESGTFTRYTYDPDDPNRPHGPRLASGLAAGTGGDISIPSVGFGVLFLHEDRTGALWIGGFGGVNRYDRTTGNLTHYDHGDFFGANSDYRFYESREGVLWIGTRNGLYRMPLEASSFERYEHEVDNPNSLSNNDVSAVLEDASGELGIGTYGGGLNRLEIETGAFTHYRYDPENSNSLSSDKVLVVYEAPSELEVIWIGTQGEGLNRFEQKTGIFTHYRHDPDNPNSLSGDEVIAIYEAPSEPGVLWIGTENDGLIRFDLATESFTVYTALSSRSYRSELFDALEALDRESRSIAALLGMGNDEDRSHPFEIAEETPVLVVSQGEYYMSALADYGWIENGAGDRVWEMSSEKTRNAGGAAANRAQIAEMRLAAGSYRLRYRSDDGLSYSDNWRGRPPDELERWGIQVYSLQGRTALLTDEDVTDISLSGRISSNYVYSIFEDNAGTLWIGTRNGLNALDREAGIFTSYLRRSRIYDIREERQDRLWLGTNEGVLLFDRNRAQEASETGYGETASSLMRVGLESSFVWDILEDDDGILWIHSTDGLARYDPDAQTSAYLDALEAGSTLITNFVRGRRGEFFLGGNNGLVHFYPGQIIDTTPPAAVLKGLHIFNEPVVPGPDSPLDVPVGLAESITLTYAQRDFTIDYVGLHFSNSQRNRYMYQLDGYDEDWVRAGTQRSARYTNLPPGSYTFHMKAANSDGVWSEEEATIGVVVLPPWWRTVWAFTVYGLLFAVGVFAVDRIQRKRLVARERLRAEREKAAALEETNRVIEATNTELQRALKHLTETQDQLIHTEKMASLGQLTAGIAHEIKNPLNFVNNFAEISANITEEIHSILEKEKTNLSAESAHELKAFLDDLKLNTQKINEHGRRADGIVRAMLEHSRTGPGERRAVDVNALLDEYVNLAYHSWQAAHPRSDTIHRVDPRVCRSYDDAVEEVEIIPQELGRVFVNLLDNAFYAVNEKRLMMNGEYGPEVSVSTKRKEDEIEIKISDNGVGIPPSVRDRVFEPFFTTKLAGSGTGLGLSLSYDIVVKGHGGSLTMESEEGEGAVFVIRLPSSFLNTD